MTSLLLKINIPEIYQTELSSNTDQGVSFALNITEFQYNFSTNNLFSNQYSVSSDVLRPDFTKMISTTVTISSEKTDSQVLVINLIRLSNSQNSGMLGSSDLESMVLNDKNVIVMGYNNETPAPGIKPCETCIETDKRSCSLYARKNSMVQFNFSLTKISGIFYMVLKDSTGIVDCNVCIANLYKLRTFPVGPNDCSSLLTCSDPNSIAKLSSYVDIANKCVEKYIDSTDMNPCLMKSRVINATSCANCLLKNNSCGVSPCCDLTCAKDGDCSSDAGGCSACVNGKCAQKSSPACGLSCVNDKECAGAADGCLACVNQTCAKKSNPSCGFSCVNDKECAGAADGCLACVNQTCAQKSQPACGSVCANDGECAGASGGCDSCMDGKCQKPKRTNIFRVLIISIFLVVFVAFLLYIILKK